MVFKESWAQTLGILAEENFQLGKNFINLILEQSQQTF